MLGEECSNLVTLMRAQPLGKEGYSVRDALGDYGKSLKESVEGVCLSKPLSGSVEVCRTTALCG